MEPAISCRTACNRQEAKTFLDFLGTEGISISHINTSMYATNDKIAIPYNVGNGELVQQRHLL